jgi:hypothetical protein
MGLFKSNEGGGGSFAGAASAAALSTLFLLQAFLLASSLKKDARPLDRGQAVLMRSAWDCRRAAAAGRWGDVLQSPRPPVVPAALAAGASFAGSLGLEAEDAAALANLAFLMLLAWSVYLLASDWWGEAAGAAAAWVAAFLPHFQDALRTLSPDMALAAWTALVYALWMRTRRFSLWGASLLLGLAGGLGLLTAGVFPLYVLPVLAAALWEVFSRRRQMSAVRALAALVTAAAVAAPWYGPHAGDLVVRFFLPGPAAGTGPSMGGLSAAFYYLGVFQEGAGWAVLAAAVGGFIWSSVSSPQNGWTLAAWLGSVYGLWTVIPDKDPSRMLPALAVLPLAAAALPARLPVVLAALVTGMSLWTSFGARSRSARPSWPLKEILEKAAALREDPSGPPASLVLAADRGRLNADTLAWTAEREGLDRAVAVRPLAASLGLGAFSEFVLAGTGQPAAGAEQEALRPDGWFQRNFSKAGEWTFPDGGGAALFHRLPAASAPAVQMDAAGALARLVPGVEVQGLRCACADGSVIQGTGDCRADAPALKVRGLLFKDVKLRLEGLRIAADDEGRPRLLDLRRLEAGSFRLGEADLSRSLAARLGPLRGVQVRFLPDGEAEASGRWAFAPVRFRAKLSRSADGRSIRAEVVSFRVLGISLPWRRGVEMSLKPGPDKPFSVDLPGLKTVPAAGTAEGALETGASPNPS